MSEIHPPSGVHSHACIIRRCDSIYVRFRMSSTKIAVGTLTALVLACSIRPSHAVDAAGWMHGIVCNAATLACMEVDDPNGIGTITFNGVNDKGQIVGFYVEGNDNTTGLLADPVLEPSMAALVGVGLLCFGVVRYRRTRA